MPLSLQQLSDPVNPTDSIPLVIDDPDEATGIVDIVPMYAGHAALGDAVARFLLTHYITVCEGFSYATAQRDYEECGAYHSAKRNTEWYNL